MARIVGIRLNSSQCQSQVKQLHLETVVRGDIVYSAGKQSSAGRANKHRIVLWEVFSGAGCRHRFVHCTHLCEMLMKLKQIFNAHSLHHPPTYLCVKQCASDIQYYTAQIQSQIHSNTHTQRLGMTHTSFSKHVILPPSEALLKE